MITYNNTIGLKHYYPHILLFSLSSTYEVCVVYRTKTFLYDHFPTSLLSIKLNQKKLTCLNNLRSNGFYNVI